MSRCPVRWIVLRCFSSGVRRRRCFVAVVTALLTFGVVFGAGGLCWAWPNETWRSTIDFPLDTLAAGPTSEYEPRWIKFIILLSDPNFVYFQNSDFYPFHYDFADSLEPFDSVSREVFDAGTLHADGQLAVLGVVLYEGGPITACDEIGIQLVRNDAYSVDEIVSYVQVVRSKINAGPEVDTFYFPTFNQRQSALAQSEALAERGVIVSSPDRWKASVCYSPGWAMGRLQYLAPDEIAAAVRNGQLGAGDILLTDGEPSELPPVAGIITLTPATPSSHAAILAQTLEIPFVSIMYYLSAEYEQPVRTFRRNGLGSSTPRPHCSETMWPSSATRSSCRTRSNKERARGGGSPLSSGPCRRKPSWNRSEGVCPLCTCRRFQTQRRSARRPAPSSRARKTA